MSKFDSSLPIAVDLDGTLIYSDLSRYSFLKFCLRYPWKALIVPIWLGRGKAYIKRQLADRVSIDPGSLVYNQYVIDFIKTYKQRGHQFVLATGSDEKYAHAIAKHLGLFDLVIASDGRINAVSHQKANRLVELYGAQNFVYLGNSNQDLAVWEKSAYAIAVNASSSVINRLSLLGVPYEVFAGNID